MHTMQTYSQIQPKRFIFTGAPGSGKTSTLQHLAENSVLIQGPITVVHEAATEIIANSQSQGCMRPWETDPEFVDKIVFRQVELQRQNNCLLQLHDRSPICTYTLGRFLAHMRGKIFTPSQALLQETERCVALYQKDIFFFQSLGFIEQTKARQINFDEACIFEQMHLETYDRFGFNAIYVPRDTIVKRALLVERILCNRILDR